MFYIRPGTQVEQQYVQDAKYLRRDLHTVIKQAHEALETLDKGIIPWPNFKTSSILYTAKDVEALAHRLDALRVLIGTVYLSTEFAMKAAAQNNDLEIPEDEA